MSYFSALGAIPAGTYPVGTRWAVGYRVTNLPSDQAAAAVQRLRDTVAYGYRGRLVSAGWGPNSGVPSGHLFALLENGASLDANTMNGIASNMAANLQTRLPGTMVANTHAHIVSQPSAAPTPAATAFPGTTAFPAAMPGFGPTPGAEMMPGYDPYAVVPEPGGLSMSIGGIPLWFLLLGGTAVIGGVVFAMMRRPRALGANRRRRHRIGRNRRRRTRGIARNQTHYVVTGR